MNRRTSVSTLVALLAGLLFFTAVGKAMAEDAQVRQVAWQTDLRRAAETAQALKMPMLVKVGAPWCVYCKKMTKETYSNREIADHVNQCFIPVVVDADQNKQFVKAVGVRSLPTTVIVSHDLKIIQRITGYKTARQLGAQLDRVCQHEKETK